MTCSPQSLKISQLSIVPNTARPSRARSRRPSTLLEQPLDLRPREVGVEHQAGALADQRLVAGLAQLVAALRGAPVLPDERAVQRLAGVRVPDDDGLALVGDADGLQLARSDARVVERLARDRARDLPDLRGVVLDPSRPREVLLELAVGPPDQLRVGVEDEAGRAGGPLVDREDHRARPYTCRERRERRPCARAASATTRSRSSAGSAGPRGVPAGARREAAALSRRRPLHVPRAPAAHHLGHRAWVRARCRVRRRAGSANRFVVGGDVGRRLPVTRWRMTSRVGRRSRPAHRHAVGTSRAAARPPVEWPRDVASSPPVEVHQDEVGKLAQPVGEPAQRPARRAVLEVELDLDDPVAGARGVDVHRGLHPEAGANGSRLPSTSPRTARWPEIGAAQVDPAERAGGPARESQRGARRRRRRAARRRRSRDRPRRRSHGARRAAAARRPSLAQIPVAEDDDGGRRRILEQPPRGQRRDPALADRDGRAHELGPVLERRVRRWRRASRRRPRAPARPGTRPPAPRAWRAASPPRCRR